MQAIVSDIIVSQAAQSGILQVSQPLNNNSSLELTFAQMLESQKAEQTDEAKATENAKEDSKVEQPDVEKPVKTASFDEEGTAGEKALEKVPQAKKAAEKNQVKNQTEEKEIPQVKGQINKKPADAGQINAKNPAKNEKIPLTDEQKKALLDKQKLEMLKIEQKEENAENAVQDKQIDLAALNSDSLNKLVNEKNTDFAENQREIENNELDLSVKSDSKADKLLEANNFKEKITVVDLRTKPQVEEKSAIENSKAAEKSVRNLKVEYKGDNTANVTMELDQQMQAAGENILSLDNQTAAANGSDFQAMVNNQIQANIPEFVQAGSILLKDNDKGTINLTLHPDDLGNVKIHLSMDGKTLSAHITVNTKEALEVFKENAQTLREAFAKNGFETASFDVSYNGNSNGQASQDFRDLYDGSEFKARKAYGDFLGGGNDDGYIQNSYEFVENSEYSINIVA